MLVGAPSASAVLWAVGEDAGGPAAPRAGISAARVSWACVELLLPGGLLCRVMAVAGMDECSGHILWLNWPGVECTSPEMGGGRLRALGLRPSPLRLCRGMGCLLR